MQSDTQQPQQQHETIIPSSFHHTSVQEYIKSNLISHGLNPDMITALIYLCINYQFKFIGYIDSGFFGSVFFVEQHGFIFALKIALACPEIFYSPVEPLLNLILSTSTTNSFPHPCLPLCYLAIHETISPQQQVTLESHDNQSNIDFSIDSPTPALSSSSPLLTLQNSLPIHIAASLLSYVPGVDLGNFTEFQLKRDYIRYIANFNITHSSSHYTQSNTHFSTPIPLTQAQYLAQHYSDIQFLTTLTVQAILAQLLLVTSYLHTIGILHRDIKPTNVLLAPQYLSSTQTVCDIASIFRNNFDPTTSSLPSSMALHEHIQKDTLAHIHTHFCINFSPFFHQQEQEVYNFHHDKPKRCEPFALIQLLDFGLSHIPFNSASFINFLQSNFEPAAPNNLYTDCGDGDDYELNLNDMYDDIEQYQRKNAYNYNLDYYAIALSVLELLLGYIPGSKTDQARVEQIIKREQTDLLKVNSYTNVQSPEIDIITLSPLSQRDIYKFIRHRKMAGILEEYDDYIAYLERKKSTTSCSDPIFKRHFTSSMIETFDLLLSPDHIDHCTAFQHDWVQELLPTITTAWTCHLHQQLEPNRIINTSQHFHDDTNSISNQLSTLQPISNLNTSTEILNKSSLPTDTCQPINIFPSYQPHINKWVMNMNPLVQSTNPLTKFVHTILLHQYTLTKSPSQRNQLQLLFSGSKQSSSSTSLQFAFLNPFYYQFLASLSTQHQLLSPSSDSSSFFISFVNTQCSSLFSLPALPSSISSAPLLSASFQPFEYDLSLLFPQLINFLQRLSHDDPQVRECEVAQRYDL